MTTIAVSDTAHALSRDQIQSRKLVLAAQSFVQRHQHLLVRTKSVDRQIRDFLCTFDHLIATNAASKPLIAELEALRASMRRLLAVRSQVARPEEHHLSGLQEVTVERIERVRETETAPKPAKRVNDSVSAARIQTLLQDQKDMYTKELEDEQKTQAVLVRELAELTSVLKETTIDMNSTVQLQNMQLDELQKFAEENEQELISQKNKMQQRTKSMTKSVFASFGLMLWIIGLFVANYMVIRLFPKSNANGTCSTTTPAYNPNYG